MTHTLHRRGTAESLRDDYIVFAMAAKGVNRDGAAPRLRQFLATALKYEPVNAGDMKTGNLFSAGAEAIMNGIADNSIVHAVFTSPEKVAALLQELRQLDLGVSVVVSGLVDQAFTCLHESGLRPHTVEFSLGIHGETALLPDEDTLTIAAMCGHGMVSFALVEYWSDRVRRGLATSSQATEELVRLCHCGVMNPVRVKRLIEAAANKA